MIDVILPKDLYYTYSGTIHYWVISGGTHLIEINIWPDCNLAIFVCSDRIRALHSHQKQTLKAGMVAAKRLILLNWKSPSSPCLKRWLNKMLSILLRSNRFVLENTIHKTIWCGSRIYLHCLMRPNCITHELCCYVVSILCANLSCI